MKASKLLWAVIMAFTFVFTSCDWVGDEPTIEGKLDKFFDSQAQRKSFRILTGSGKPYNHKSRLGISLASQTPTQIPT